MWLLLHNDESIEIAKDKIEMVLAAHRHPVHVTVERFGQVGYCVHIPPMFRQGEGETKPTQIDYATITDLFRLTGDKLIFVYWPEEVHMYHDDPQYKPPSGGPTLVGGSLTSAVIGQKAAGARLRPDQLHRCAARQRKGTYRGKGKAGSHSDGSHEVAGTSRD